MYKRQIKYLASRYVNTQSCFFIGRGFDYALSLEGSLKLKEISYVPVSYTHLLINGKIAKASQAVKAGDIIEVTFGNRPIKVKVLSDVEPRTKEVAREMYEIIAEGEQA